MPEQRRMVKHAGGAGGGGGPAQKPTMADFSRRTTKDSQVFRRPAQLPRIDNTASFVGVSQPVWV